MSPVVQLLGLCGSLRARSSNRALLLAYARACAPGGNLVIYDGLAALPHFNADLDQEDVPAEVRGLRTLVSGCDGVVISTPEYAHALPGTLKNALDWLVSDPAFAGKPTVLLMAARGSTWAADSLREVLRTMSADVLEAQSLSLPLGTNTVDDHAILARPELAGPLRQSAEAVVQYCRSRRLNGVSERSVEDGEN